MLPSYSGVYRNVCKVSQIMLIFVFSATHSFAKTAWGEREGEITQHAQGVWKSEEPQEKVDQLGQERMERTYQTGLGRNCCYSESHWVGWSDICYDMVIRTRTEDALFSLNFVPLKNQESFILFLSQAQSTILSLACSSITWFGLQAGGVLASGKSNPCDFRQYSKTNSITFCWPIKTTALGLKILTENGVLRK